MRLRQGKKRTVGFEWYGFKTACSAKNPNPPFPDEIVL